MEKKKLLALICGAGVVLTGLFMAGCSATTANLSDVRVCDKLEGDACGSDMATLGTTAGVFYVTANLNNAPSGTKIDISWKYLGGEAGQAQDIDSVSMVSDENSNTVQSSLERSPSVDAWPRGNYEVALTINADNVEPVTKDFSVK